MELAWVKPLTFVWAAVIAARRLEAARPGTLAHQLRERLAKARADGADLHWENQVEM